MPNRQKSLKHRLTLAVALPVICLLGVGALLGVQVSRMSVVAGWVTHSDAVIADTFAVQQAVSAKESSLRGYLLSRDNDHLVEFAQSDPLTLLEELGRATRDNSEQQERVANARPALERWLASAAVALESPGIGAERAALVQRHGLADEVHSVVEDMREAELSLRRDRSLLLDESTERTRWAFVVLLSLTAMALAFVSRRSLTQTVDSYGAALKGEREARERLQEEEGVRSGLLALSEAIRGDRPLEEICSRALSSLASSLGADVATCFARDDHGWLRVAGFGITNSGSPNKFARGEGLVGRTESASTLVHVRDVPEGYLKLQSGLGDSTVRELVLVPARHEGETLAILEFGFLRSPTPQSLSLCSRAGDALAAAVRSAEHKRRLRELLDESRRQAEELQRQQEQLRSSNEELEEQTAALREAQQRLEERHEELETLNASLEHQASVLERTQDSLRDQAQLLEQANRYKSEFLANISHELRTPLNSSLILARLLAENKDNNLSEEQVRFARSIHAAGEDLLTLINDVLDLSKVEAGHVDLDLTTTSITHLVEDMRAMFEPLAQEKGLRFEVEVGAGVPSSLRTDEHRARQILKNLLSNALKFTQRGDVRLRVHAAGDDVEFEVSDTGVGIAKDKQEAVFEAFRQADGTISRRFGGTGLGLSISRNLARLLGGDVSLESRAGEGSTFRLRLPRAITSPPPPPEGDGLSLSPRQRRSRVARPVGIQHSLRDDRLRLEEDRRILLVVEDDLKFAEILVDLAHELDFQCLVATSAREALQLTQWVVPTAVLLDIHLPDRSGLSVLETLKRDPRTRHVPVHAVSVSDHKRQALEMGALGYIEKPAKREELVDAVRKMEHRANTRRRNVLIVSAKRDQMSAVSDLLQSEDVSTTQAGTVREALSCLSETEFDCVVTDVDLPDASGRELLERMAKELPDCFPPVVVYADEQLPSKQEQDLRRHARAIIIKGARSVERLLDEVTLFLHQVESELPPERRRMLQGARDREKRFEGCRVLVVEDDVRNVFALTSLLEPRGVDVVVARDGKQALECLEQESVDLVLMDIMMPEMDGLEATRAIRTNANWRGLPVIALTARAMIDDQEACIQAGANDCIAKPLDNDALLSLLRVWLPTR